MSFSRRMPRSSRGVRTCARQQGARLLVRFRWPSLSGCLHSMQTWSHSASPALPSVSTLASPALSACPYALASSACFSSFATERQGRRSFFRAPAALSPEVAPLPSQLRAPLYVSSSQTVPSADVHQLLYACIEKVAFIRLPHQPTVALHTRPLERLYTGPLVAPVLARSFGGFEGNSIRTKTSEAFEPHKNSSTTRVSNSSSPAFTIANSQPSSDSAVDTSSAQASPSAPAPSPPSGSSSAADVAVDGSAGTSWSLPGIADASSRSRSDSSDAGSPRYGAAPRVTTCVGPGPLASSTAAPRRLPGERGSRESRLVLPPLLPQAVKSSGVGGAMIAAAMDKAVEIAAGGKRNPRRKLSGGDHMRTVVPQERKKRTKHTGGQNSTY